MRYLYIFEDNTIGQSMAAPTDTDRTLAADGALTVIRLNRETGLFEELGPHGDWLPSEEASIRREDDATFHFVG